MIAGGLGRFSLVLLGAYGLASSAAAQAPNWIRQIGSSEDDRGFAAAPDGVGGAYVAGYTTGRLGGPNAGFFSPDAWLARYDPVGDRVWIRQFGTRDQEALTAAASRHSGGVFVAGHTRGDLAAVNLGYLDAWVALFDGAGTRLWTRQLGTASMEIATTAASDGSGGVFVGGWTEGSLGGPSAGGQDAWLAHYDGAGNLTWTRQLGTSSTSLSAAAGDGAGGVYVGGHTYGFLGGPSAGGSDAWLARYDGAGARLWIRQLGSAGAERLSAACVDGAGGVFVAGETNSDLGGPSAGEQDVWIAHYDGAGQRTWIRQLGSSVGDRLWGAAPDGAGGVYVTGSTNGSLGGPVEGPADAWVAHYDGAGTPTWLRQLGTGGVVAAHGAAEDGSGGVFLAGSTNRDLGGPGTHAGSWDAWLAHLRGSLVGTRYCAAAPNSTGQAGHLDAAGSPFRSINAFELRAERLPRHSFGFFLASRTPGSAPAPGASQGVLCLAGDVGHFDAPGRVLSTGTGGVLTLAVDLTQMPSPTGAVAVQPGETWYFQAWHRDANPGPTSNLTDAISIQFF